MLLLLSSFLEQRWGAQSLAVSVLLFFFFLIFIYLHQVLVSTLGIVASCSLVEVSRLSRSAAYGILL